MYAVHVLENYPAGCVAGSAALAILAQSVHLQHEGTLVIYIPVCTEGLVN